jgi:telomere length regulation protein
VGQCLVDVFLWWLKADNHILAHAQVLLLAVGHVHRLAPIKLISLVKTGGYLTTISNRIAASQPRARFLGMVVAETLSAMVDGEARRLKFGLPELDTEEAAWWRALVGVLDEASDVDALLVEAEEQKTKALELAKPKEAAAKTMVPRPIAPLNDPEPGEPMKPKPAKGAKPKPLIQVVDDDGDNDDNDDDADPSDSADLAPYAKPAFDPEDSDDDPTLVTRNKAQPPVYVRTLLEYLRASDDVDRQLLALQHAPRLIRAKAHHGVEVSSHAAELASQLIGMKDNFAVDDFADMRLRGLVALVVACPEAMGPWMARALWEGDFNNTERTSLLIALGLGAREVAGLQQPEDGEAADWVGKRLPARMERLYIEEAGAAPSSATAPRGASLKPLARNAIDTAAHDITSAFLAPLAARAADASTGPDALKLAPFTSRLTKYKSATGGTRPSAVKAIPNTTSALICASFFAPLHARLAYSLRRRHAVMHTPPLLATYVKTLGLLVHASGASTLALPQMTTELWDLVLALRGTWPGDVGVAAALLGALVALLEVNDVSSTAGARRLCADHAGRLVESREWAVAVFGAVRGEGEDDERDVKALAAGLLVRLDEVAEKHRLLLMGTAGM